MDRRPAALLHRARAGALDLGQRRQRRRRRIGDTAMTLQYATRTASRTYSQADIEKSRAAFDELCRLLNPTPSRRGEVDYDCTGCHHAVVKGKTHFSFSAKGGKCFSCNWHGGIYKVAKAIGMTIRDRASVAQILDTPKR